VLCKFFLFSGLLFFAEPFGRDPVFGYKLAIKMRIITIAAVMADLLYGSGRHDQQLPGLAQPYVIQISDGRLPEIFFKQIDQVIFAVGKLLAKGCQIQLLFTVFFNVIGSAKGRGIGQLLLTKFEQYVVKFGCLYDIGSVCVVQRVHLLQVAFQAGKVKGAPFGQLSVLAPLGGEVDEHIFGGRAGQVSTLEGVVLLNMVFPRVHLVRHVVFAEAQNAVVHQQQNVILAKAGYVMLLLGKKAERRKVILNFLVQIYAVHINHPKTIYLETVILSIYKVKIAILQMFFS